MEESKKQVKILLRRIEDLKMLLEAKNLILQDKNDIIMELKSQLYDKNKEIRTLLQKGDNNG